MTDDKDQKDLLRYLGTLAQSNQNPDGFIVEYKVADKYLKVSEGTTKELISELVEAKKFQITEEWDDQIQLIKIVKAVWL